jgi:hypothetical protein
LARPRPGLEGVAHRGRGEAAERGGSGEGEQGLVGVRQAHGCDRRNGQQRKEDRGAGGFQVRLSSAADRFSVGVARRTVHEVPAGANISVAARMAGTAGKHVLATLLATSRA